MKIGLATDSFGELSLEGCLDRVAQIGLSYVEFSLGGWSSAPHVNIDEMLSNDKSRDRLISMVRDRGLAISALNCSGNPLHPKVGKSDAELAQKTVDLAYLMGINRIVMMSGLPAAPGDSYPNWITSSWPPEAMEILEWQWNERILPFWREFAAYAERKGLRICIEQHGRQAVYNNESFFRLRNEIGPVVGVNFDPSHLIWMGGDPISAIRNLGGECIYHVHGKDTFIEEEAKINGLIDSKPDTPAQGRSWNYVCLGHGNSARVWLNILKTLLEVGYNDVISIENEDYSLDADTGIITSAKVLKFCIETLETGRHPH